MWNSGIKRLLRDPGNAEEETPRRAVHLPRGLIRRRTASLARDASAAWPGRAVRERWFRRRDGEVVEPHRRLFSSDIMRVMPNQRRSQVRRTAAAARANLAATYEQFMATQHPKKRSEVGRQLIQAVFGMNAIAEDPLR